MTDERKKAARFELQGLALKKKAQRERGQRVAARERHLKEIERENATTETEEK